MYKLSYLYGGDDLDFTPIVPIISEPAMKPVIPIIPPKPATQQLSSIQPIIPPESPIQPIIPPKPATQQLSAIQPIIPPESPIQPIVIRPKTQKTTGGNKWF